MAGAVTFRDVQEVLVQGRQFLALLVFLSKQSVSPSATVDSGAEALLSEVAHQIDKCMHVPFVCCDVRILTAVEAEGVATPSIWFGDPTSGPSSSAQDTSSVPFVGALGFM